MKKILVNYLIVVSLTYIILGLTSFFALRHHLVAFPILNFAVCDTHSELMNILWWRIPTVIFGFLGIVGIYLIKKEKRSGVIIWAFLSVLLIILTLANIYWLMGAYRNTDFGFSGSFEVLPFTVISTFWAFTYLFSFLYLRSHKIVQSVKSGI